MRSLTLTVIGPDRPGLVGALSERVAAAGGNWLESRMARLAGQFAGVVLVEAPDDGAADRLARDLGGLEAEGLRVLVAPGLSGEPAAAPTPTGRHALTLELVGQDHPGIVRDIARALAGRGVNIDELATEVASGSFSGERLFRATARLSAPAELPTEALRDALEALANELMVDVDIEEASPERQRQRP
jgi:glycine cleavage system regulatory protein